MIEQEKDLKDMPEPDVPDSGVEAEAENGPEAETLPSDPDALREMLAKEQEQLDECRGRLLRLHADFDNFRRRTRKEKEEWFRQASEDVVSALLPVLDNFDRALSAPGSDLNSFVAGVRMIYRQLEDVLAEQGLESMTSEGTNFDPECHDCVERVEDSEKPDNIVVEELRRGYYYKGKVLRPAMVRVNKHAE